MKPAIGIIEYKSIAKGIKATDYILKKAPVKILLSTPVCPGKYVILFSGDEASVYESLIEGKDKIRESIVDDLYLPNVDIDVINAIRGVTKVTEIDSVGILESFTVASCVEAADIAVKETNVRLIEMRLAVGLGGKSFFTLTGELHEVEASISRASSFCKEKGFLFTSEIIPAPHIDMKGVLL